MKFIFTYIYLFLLLSALSYAQNSKDNIDEIKANIAIEQKQQDEQAQKAIEAARILAKLQDNIRDHAKKSQQIEFDIIELQQERTQLLQQHDKILVFFNDNKDDFIHRLAALKALKKQGTSILPIILYPGSPIDSLRAQNLLKYAVPDLLRDMGKYRELLYDISITIENITQKDMLLQAQQIKLNNSKRDLENDMAQRAAILANHQEKLAQSALRVKELNQKLSDLNKLVTEISKPKPPTTDQTETEDMIDLVELRAFPDTRSLLSPVVGRVTKAYGQSLGKTQHTRAVTLKALPEAQIIAPYDGEIAFAGEFKNLGNVIIIEHIGGYHSVIVGASTYYVYIGQKVTAGEPIGRLNKQNTDIQYELRRDGQPINPLAWINKAHIKLAKQ